MRKAILRSPSLKNIFINKETGDVFKEAELLKRPQLAETLEKVAEFGPDFLYNGAITDAFVQDIQDQGGIITRNDMASYKPTWMLPESIDLPGDLLAVSAPLPGSGCVLLLILKVLFSLNMPPTTVWERWFRLVETWKHAFGLRYQLDGPNKDTLKTPNVPSAIRINKCAEVIGEKVARSERTSEDLQFYADRCFEAYRGGGTCHVCVLSPNGDAASATSSINCFFGANFASPSTGIILNNHLYDFSSGQYSKYRYNDLKPNKQPLSSMAPTIILNKSDKTVRLIIGSAGGCKIITSISQVVLEHIFYGVPLGQAVNSKRLHHQLLPMVLYYEEEFPYIRKLEKLGHQTKMMNARFVKDAFSPASSSLTVIGMVGKYVEAYADPRRNGVAVMV